MTYRVLDLFSGIGGFSLGLESTGHFQTVAFCEIEPYCQRVLAKHWPEVPCYDDVREIMADADSGHELAEKTLQAGRYVTGPCGGGRRTVGPIDVITAGFPCQDISTAGKGAGIEGERSGLWSEVARLAGELVPKYVLLENVAALCARGLGTVLGDLAEVGYDCEWHCIPVSHIGAPHRRDRWWAVAYPVSERQPGPGEHEQPGHPAPGAIGQAIDALYGGVGQIWTTEPDVGRVAHGVPGRVDRLRGLGNAVVPQIPALLGRAIIEAEQ